MTTPFQRRSCRVGDPVEPVRSVIAVPGRGVHAVVRTVDVVVLDDLDEVAVRVGGPVDPVIVAVERADGTTPLRSEEPGSSGAELRDGAGHWSVATTGGARLFTDPKFLRRDNRPARSFG